MTTGLVLHLDAGDDLYVESTQSTEKNMHEVSPDKNRMQKNALVNFSTDGDDGPDGVQSRLATQCPSPPPVIFRQDDSKCLSADQP